MRFAEFAFVVSAFFLVTGVHSEDCGQARPMINPRNPAEVGEGIAAEGQWPWMVAITSRDRSGGYSPWCTGFLIDRKHVISAAHCFHDRGDGLYSTRIGAVNQTQGKEYPISNIVVPEGYRPGMYYDNIAILTLTKEVDDPNFTPICLPDAEVAGQNLDGTGTTVAGWGSETPDGPQSIFLKLVDMTVVSLADCNNAFQKRFPGSSLKRQFPRGIDGGFICAEFIEGKSDACGGYSGGPLMLQDRNRWFAVGIVSFGYSCGIPGMPSGYTRVSANLRWIRENTKN